MSLNLLATTTMGLEAVVSRELNDLGYENRIVGLGRVAFEGDEEAVCQANLWLRSAGHVLIEMDRFQATDFDMLYDRTRAIAWDRWIPADGLIHVKGRSVRSQLSSVPACQRTVKKAIVEQLMKAHHTTTLNESGATFTVEVSILKDEVVLSIDTTGHGLHRRGYRKLTGDAPLRETIAAGLVQLSFWKPERPLVDPFCGSGTIPIEAAMIGLNIAPGLNRSFEAESWITFPKLLWRNAREVARNLRKESLPERIIGTDISEDALSLARYHAKQAGVDEMIHFQRRDFAELSSKRDYGCVITNPPYAQRMGDDSEVVALYESMPGVFRRMKTWSFFILTAYPGFEQLLGQEANRRRKLYNSTIECTYYQYHGPRRPRDYVTGDSSTSSGPRADEPEAITFPGRSDLQQSDTSTGDPAIELIAAESEIKCVAQPSAEPSVQSSTESLAEPPSKQPPARPSELSAPLRPVQAFGGLNEKSLQQAEIFANRLRKNARHLRRWPTRRGITCYRLYDRDIPEVPVAVDRYDDALHIAEYERPHQHTPAEHADWLDLIAKTAADVMEIPKSQVFVKHRQRQRGTSQYERVGSRSYTSVVEEGGLRFEVNLSDYLDTGLFLDHRVTRSMVRDSVREMSERCGQRGCRFLNLFAYTGSFSVYAADGGARTTTTVDLSGTYLDWAARNMALNGFDSPGHQRVRADAITFLDSLPEDELFDLAVVDPPTFSNSKRTEEIWDVQRDYAALLNRLTVRLSPGGIIFFSTNFKRFKFDDFLFPGFNSHEISKQTVPEDFRNRRIHRCWKMMR